MDNSELLASHDELRAALIVAGREIRRLQSGRLKSRMLPKVLDVLRVARRISSTYRVPSDAVGPNVWEVTSEGLAALAAFKQGDLV